MTLFFVSFFIRRIKKIEFYYRSDQSEFLIFIILFPCWWSWWLLLTHSDHKTNIDEIYDLLESVDEKLASTRSSFEAEVKFSCYLNICFGEFKPQFPCSYLMIYYCKIFTAPVFGIAVVELWLITTSHLHTHEINAKK